jgi:thioredoxin 1
MSENIIAITDNSFEKEVLKSDIPVLVDFWAEWCNPCKMISPILEEVAKERKGQITVAKINIDENAEAPVKYGVLGIPTLILFKQGRVEATKVGALTKSQLDAFIEENL